MYMLLASSNKGISSQLETGLGGHKALSRRMHFSLVLEVELSLPGEAGQGWAREF